MIALVGESWREGIEMAEPKSTAGKATGKKTAPAYLRRGWRVVADLRKAYDQCVELLEGIDEQLKKAEKEKRRLVYIDGKEQLEKAKETLTSVKRNLLVGVNDAHKTAPPPPPKI